MNITALPKIWNTMTLLSSSDSYIEEIPNINSVKRTLLCSIILSDGAAYKLIMSEAKRCNMKVSLDISDGLNKMRSKSLQNSLQFKPLCSVLYEVRNKIVHNTHICKHLIVKLVDTFMIYRKGVTRSNVFVKDFTVMLMSICDIIMKSVSDLILIPENLNNIGGTLFDFELTGWKSRIKNKRFIICSGKWEGFIAVFEKWNKTGTCLVKLANLKPVNSKPVEITRCTKIMITYGLNWI